MRLIVLALAALAAPAAIHAADSFDGLSAGVHLGYAHSETSISDKNYWWYGGTYDINDKGGLAGVDVAYDRQFGGLLVGGVLDWTYTTLGTKYGYSDTDPVDVTVTTSIDWYATLRGRAGLVVDRTALYVTAGLAYAEAKTKWNDRSTQPNRDFSVTNDNIGLAYGVGLMHRINQQWSLNGELLTISIPDKSNNEIISGGDRWTFKIGHEIAAARVGLAYHF